VEAHPPEQLLTVIAQETGAKASDILASTRLDSLVADSLEFLSLVSAVENAFNFKIPDKRYTEVQTVGDLCSLIPDHVPS